MTSRQKSCVLFTMGCVAARVMIVLAVIAAPAAMLAQTDEIQVYDAGIAEPGIFNVTIHTNYTPIGRKSPAFPGAIVAQPLG